MDKLLQLLVIFGIIVTEVDLFSVSSANSNRDPIISQLWCLIAAGPNSFT